MAHGTARAAASAVLGLVALQAVGSRGGSGRIAELFNDANTILERVLDPAVPAIPDLRVGGSWGGARELPGGVVAAAITLPSFLGGRSTPPTRTTRRPDRRLLAN